MEVYTLTGKGRQLAHSVRGQRTADWGVVYFLSKNGSATKDQILSYVSGASISTIVRLKARRIITDQSGG